MIKGMPIYDARTGEHLLNGERFATYNDRRDQQRRDQKSTGIKKGKKNGK